MICDMYRLKRAIENHSKYTTLSISALFVLGFLLSYSFLTKIESYQNNIDNSERRFVLFESLLLKPSFHLYSTKGELSRYSDFSKILKKDWNLLWLQWDKLKFISNEKYNASIEKHLTILELNHWLYISYTNNQLPARHQYLLQEEIIPISNEIFNISTTLINQLKEKNNVILLAHAADFRGYFTNASQQLTATATTSASPIWDNYKKSVKAATDAIHNIQKTQPYNNDLVTQLVNKLYKLQPSIFIRLISAYVGVLGPSKTAIVESIFIEEGKFGVIFLFLLLLCL